MVKGRPPLLLSKQIKDVQELHFLGLSIRELAKIYKVSRMCIFRALQGDLNE